MIEVFDKKKRELDLLREGNISIRSID